MEPPSFCEQCRKYIDYGTGYFRCRELESPRSTNVRNNYFVRNPNEADYCADCHYGCDHEGYYSGNVGRWRCVEDCDARKYECDHCGADDRDLFLSVDAKHPKAQKVLRELWFCLVCLNSAATPTQLQRSQSVP